MEEEKEKKNEVAQASPYKSYLSKMQDLYYLSVTDSLQTYKLDCSKNDKANIIASVGKINELLSSNGMTFKDIDQSNITQILTTIITLKLNPSAVPRECYFQLRNVKVGDDYKKIIEMGIEGAGNDAILRNFGVDVKSVMTPFLIREGDEFTFPYFDGEKMQPLTWHPKSLTNKIVMVVYVITKTDGTREFAMADRESVAENLKAHIINNLRSVDDETKNKIIEKIEPMKLDDMLSDASLRKVNYKKKTWNKESKSYTYEDATISAISPAWYQASSREAMIERKIRNNAIKKYPKKFNNELESNGYESTFEDYEQYREKNASSKSNPVDAIDVEVNEKQGITKANPILMPNSSNNEEIVHNEAKNEQISNNNEDSKEELPY